MPQEHNPRQPLRYLHPLRDSLADCPSSPANPLHFKCRLHTHSDPPELLHAHQLLLDDGGRIVFVHFGGEDLFAEQSTRGTVHDPRMGSSLWLCGYLGHH